MEVGSGLLCIFNDRPMPGARESGKILFVTCWRCAEAPAPQLILGKMRMPAGWPAGWAGWSGAGELGAAQGLLGIVVIPWHGSCCWVCMGWAALGHLEAGALSPSPVYKGVNSSSIPAPAAAACLAVPVPQVGTACASSQGTQRTFLGKVSTWKWVQAPPDSPYLHTGAHHTSAVPWLFEMQTPAGHRSALRPA